MCSLCSLPRRGCCWGFRVPGTTQRSPKSPSLSSKLSWNRRGMRNNLSSPTFVLLTVFPRGATQGKLTLGSDLHGLDPLHHHRVCPGGSQGSGWFAQPQTPLLSKEVRSVLPFPLLLSGHLFFLYLVTQWWQWTSASFPGPLTTQFPPCMGWMWWDCHFLHIDPKPSKASRGLQSHPTERKRTHHYAVTSFPMDQCRPGGVETWLKPSGLH